MSKDLYDFRFDKIDKTLERLGNDIVACRLEIAKLKLRSSLWGGFAGLGAALGVVVWKFILS
jgi:hypothetical protein